MNKFYKIFIGLSFTSLLFGVYGQELAIKHTSNKNLLDKIETDFSSHPEYNLYTLDIPIENIELIQLRTENSKTFYGVDDQYRIQQTAGVFHYKNEKGEWLTIQNEISKSNNEYGVFKSKLPIKINIESGLSEMTLTGNGEKMQFGKEVHLEYIGQQGNVLGNYVSSVNEHITHENNVILKDIFSKIDRIQHVNFWDLRTDYIIKQKLELPENTHYIQFSDLISIPNNWTIEQYEGEMTELGWQGSLAVKNKNGETMSVISLPKFYDSSLKDSITSKSRHAIIGTYKLQKEGDNYRLKLIVPTDWLNNPNLVYPVIIDPTSTNTYAQNQGVEDKYNQFSAGCQAVMNLTFPATGSYQVTGSNTSYQIWAKGYLGDIYDPWYGYTSYYADRVEQRSRVGSLNGWTATQSGVGTNFNGPWSVNYNSMYYNLTNQTIANGCYTNQPTIPYYWQGYQTFLPETTAGGPPSLYLYGCRTDYHELVVNTWIVTATYTIASGNPLFSNPGPICEGDNFILPTTSQNGITGTWSPAINNTVTTTYTFSPSGQTCGVSDTMITVVVNPKITPTFSNPGPICTGMSLTLPTSSNNGVTGTWSPAPNNTATTTYTFTPGAGECANTAQLTVDVETEITPSFTNPGPICEGVSFTLPTTSDNGVDGTWSPAVNSNTTTTYTFSPVNGAGICPANTVTMEVVIKPAPIIDAGTDIDICIGEGVTLTATNPGGATISWDNGITDGVSFTPVASGFTAYTVTATLDDCTATDFVVVTVHDLPNVNAGPDQTVCVGESVVLTATGAQTYAWDNNISNGVSFIPNSTTTYTVIGTDAFGCENTDQATINISSAAVPTPNFAGDNLTGCEPHTVNFTNNSGLQNITCEWTFGDGSSSTDCDNISHTYTTHGAYDVTLTITDENGCKGTLTMNDYIIVTPQPVANFTANPMIVDLNNTEVNFTNTSIGATDYIWNFGDNTPTENTFHATHSFPDTQGGDYVVTLTASNGINCSNSMSLTIKVEDNLIFYVPNSFTPDNDNFNDIFQPVFTEGFDPLSFTMFIYNRWGEKLFESNDAAIGWDGTYGVNSNEIVPSGVYIWKIHFKEKGKDKRNEITGHITVIK